MSGLPDIGFGAADEASKTKKTQATRLVELAVDTYKLGRAATGEAFAVKRGGPHIARMMRGGRNSLRAELAAAFNLETGSAPSSSALADAMLTLEGRALREDVSELALRVAQHQDTLVVDLGREDGHVVIIEPGKGWRVAESSPVLFRRTELTGELPEPTTGTLENFKRISNISETSWPLFKAWLVAALFPDIAHPVLFNSGTHGAGKTTLARNTANLIDPSPAPVRTAPKDGEAWAVAASSSHVVAIDNVSSIPAWFSDTLCRAVTGDGVLRRRLYTDSDISVLSIRRVIILTSIDAGAMRGDLADRLVINELDPIKPRSRRSDHDIDDTFERIHASTLGGLFELASKVLAILPEVRLDELPRMADFARIVSAVDAIEGTEALKHYLEAGKDLAADVVDGDPVARAIRDLAASGFDGRMADLYEKITPADVPKYWPKDAARLSGRLRRAAPALEEIGVRVEIQRGKNGAAVTVERVPEGDAKGDAGDAEVTLQTPPQRHLFGDEPAGHPAYAPNGDAGDAVSRAFSLFVEDRETEGERETDTSRSENSVTTVTSVTSVTSNGTTP